jgi:hypothetical protein
VSFTSTFSFWNSPYSVMKYPSSGSPLSGRGNCRVTLRKGSKVMETFLQSGHMIFDLYWPANKSEMAESLRFL